jgi:threonine dehydratase
MDVSSFDIVSAVEEAYARIRNDILRTPLSFSESISLATGARVFIKWENRQTTGSFKLRGALAKTRSLSAAKRRAGLISASTGNHGLGLAHACRLEGLDLLLTLPRTAADEKVARLRKAGAAIRFRGESCEKAERSARRDGRRLGRTYVSPYNDLDVIAGQGTLGLEILDDLPGLADIIVPVGGGGLIAGVAGYVKSKAAGVRVFGVEPAASAFMEASLRAGRLVSIPEGRTLADAVAGGIEPGSVTFPLCRRYVDRILTVGERVLGEAVRRLTLDHGETVEGAGALPLAALLKFARLFSGRTVVLLVSGGNISSSALAKIIRV